MADVQLAEPAQLPPHVVQVQHPGLVDPQPHICRQPGHHVVAGGRGELAARSQLLPPPGEQLPDLRLSRRHAQLRADRSARPVHLIQRALDHTAGQVMQLDLVLQLQELEVHRQRGRPPGARRRPRIPQHPAEVAATSPATPATPAPGPPGSTTTPSPVAKTTPTPSASSPCARRLVRTGARWRGRRLRPWPHAGRRRRRAALRGGSGCPGRRRRRRC